MTRRIEKIIFTFLLCGVILVGSNVQAQKSTQVKAAQYMTENIASQLNLTERQASEVYDLNKTAVQSLSDLTAKAQQDTTLKGAKLTKQTLAILKKRNQDLYKILTPEQKNIFQENKALNLADLKTRVMMVHLDLTDDQIPQVYLVNTKYATQVVKDVENAKNDKKAVKAIDSDTKAEEKELKAILSPEQYGVYSQNRETIMQTLKQEVAAANKKSKK